MVQIHNCYGKGGREKVRASLIAGVTKTSKITPTLKRKVGPEPTLGTVRRNKGYAAVFGEDVTSASLTKAIETIGRMT